MDGKKRSPWDRGQISFFLPAFRGGESTRAAVPKEETSRLRSLGYTSIGQDRCFFVVSVFYQKVVYEMRHESCWRDLLDF